MFISQHQAVFDITLMCKVLRVSRSGYYAFIQRPNSHRQQEDERQGQLIRACFNHSRHTYGYRRLHADLHAQQEVCGKHRVLRLMRLNQLSPKTKRKFKMTTDSNHQRPIYENKLQRQFHAPEPNQRWVSDITYVATQAGWLYLAVIMDLFSRKIIGWSMSDRMQETLVMDALKMALFRRKVSSYLMLHSDRGSQYASHNFQRLLHAHGIECSMSRRGNCWDNSAMESFFRSLKTECIYHENFQSREEARKTIFEYIEVFYNQQRRHSYLKYQSPADYEKLMRIA